MSGARSLPMSSRDFPGFKGIKSSAVFLPIDCGQVPILNKELRIIGHCTLQTYLQTLS